MIINKSDINVKCQVFTPEDYVKKLLNLVGYKHNVFGKKILESSCGSGNILIEIVRRYIEDSKKQGFSKKEIKNGLSRDIYGFEIDKFYYDKCILNLNDLVAEYGIKNVVWKIYNEDYLKNKNETKFDYIVGNPPYITYRDLSLAERDYIKTEFNTCKKGKFDYCYAFIEKNINSLSSKGKMSYLVPSTIFKTVFGQSLREFMKPNIHQIIDYTNDKIFDNALVKSAIVIFDKRAKKDSFIYVDESNRCKMKIFKKDLKDKWIFSKNHFIGNRRFGDYFSVSHVVATLLNEAFVISDYEKEGEYYIVNGKYIEKSIVRDTITPRTNRTGKQEKIIFPYSYDKKGNLIRYSEQNFKTRFKEAYKYLLSFKKKLDARTSDINASWFEYGRSQALNSINSDKLLVSIVITDKVKTQLIGKNVIPYAGVFITVKKENKKYNLDDARELLESEGFLDYARNIGININGNSLRVTSKDIENYIF